jgi:hypothetical protein
MKANYKSIAMYTSPGFPTVTVRRAPTKSTGFPFIMLRNSLKRKENDTVASHFLF